MNSRNPLQDGSRPQGERISVGDTHGEAEESQRTESRDEIESRRDIWSIQGGFIYRRHVKPRVQFFVAQEERFPIPLGVWFKGYPRCVATLFCLCRTQAGDVDVRCCTRSWTCCAQEGKTSSCLLAPRDHDGQDGHALCESPLSAETNGTVCRHWFAKVYLDLHGLRERKS